MERKKIKKGRERLGTLSFFFSLSLSLYSSFLSLSLSSFFLLSLSLYLSLLIFPSSLERGEEITHTHGI